MNGIVISNFQKIFSTQTNLVNYDSLPHLFPVLDEDVQINLTRKVCENEVRLGLFGIGGLKAPSPDGYPAIFFQNQWVVCKKELISLVVDSFNTGTFPIVRRTNLPFSLTKKPSHRLQIVDDLEQSKLEKNKVEAGKSKSIGIMRVDVESVPLASFPSVNTAQYEPPNASFSFPNSRTPAYKTLSNEVVDISSDEEVNVNAHTKVGGANVYSEDDEEYNPYENSGLYSEETEYGVHFKDSTDLNFCDDNDDGDANNSSNESDDDCLSYAVSFIWDNNLMVDGSTEVVNDENKPAATRRGIPFRPNVVGRKKHDVRLCTYAAYDVQYYY
ncbi:hypothetical protein QYF36_005392 [Acer negundo]|nr:hypothetical protein QYF36_005392 [Acer negundo]